MGTKESNIEKFKKLWEIFINEVEKSNLLESNNLSGFAKYYQKHSDSSEDNDYKKVYEKLKKMKTRTFYQKNVRNETLYQLEEFYKVLNTKYIKHNSFDDETYENWFT